jgi:C-terminal processing protease CtpA/Prc
MVGRVRNGTLYIGGYGTAAPLRPIIDAVDAASAQLHVKTMGAGGLGPSDHMSFALEHIPVLFLFSGLHEDYHRPTDDADKINFGGIEQVVEFAEQIVRDLTDMPRAQYVDASDSFSSIGSFAGSGHGGSRVQLGVIPDYNTEDSATGGGGGGVRIQGTVPGSAAAQAGLKRGDVIVKFDEDALASLYDLSEHLADAKPGDKVHLTVRRDKQTLQMEATLTERETE